MGYSFIMATRRERLEEHDNDYGFDPREVLDHGTQLAYSPSVSVVIPYFETGKVFEAVLVSLRAAIDRYGGDVEVIVVDDGSVKRPLVDYMKAGGTWLKPIFLPENMGRTEARNRGMRATTNDIVLFLDSDILIDDLLIFNHVRLQAEALSRGRRAIVVSFFEFTDKNDSRIFEEGEVGANLRLNDFRLDCTYGATWIGCEDDKRFIGQHIKLVEETNQFRSWRGKYKAWMLPNMVLGGAFSVWRDEILAIGGFDARFKGYGFTETSAVTRLVAERANVVIPCVAGGGLHIDDEAVNVSRTEKDKIFKEKHAFYNNVFLMEEV